MFVNKISFGSRIIRNDLFNWGMEQARDDAKDYQYNVNAFVNAVNYLKNDGKNDTYSLAKENGPRSLAILLLKNGEPVKKASDIEIGHSVEDVFISYVKDDLGVDVNKPITASIKQDILINEIKQSIEQTQENLSENLNKLNDIRLYSNRIREEEMKEKVKQLDSSIAYRI